MIPYWLLFAIPGVVALFELPRMQAAHRLGVGLALFAFALTLMIGLRHEVGGDWFAYWELFQSIAARPARDLPFISDPGYALVNWTAERIGADIWLVNLVCASLFIYGLLSFVRWQPRPWLALLVAVPYLIIVVAMGYTRQGVAIGCVMAGLSALTRQRSILKFVLWALIAASFHKTAVLIIPLAALTASRGRIWTSVWILIAAALAYFVFLRESVDHLWHGYVELQYESEGAVIRVAMNALPSAVFLIFRRRFDLPRMENAIWTNMAIGGLLFVPLLIVSPSSTAVDRMALYLIPIQLLVLSRLPDAVGRLVIGGRKGLILLVITYTGLVQFVWLNFSAHAARGWLPYQSLLLM